jgi:hypothetical protein
VAPAGAADLLVVGDRRRGRPDVHDEPEVGLVETHAEGRGRDQRLDLLSRSMLEPLAVGGSVRPV